MPQLRADFGSFTHPSSAWTTLSAYDALVSRHAASWLALLLIAACGGGDGKGRAVLVEASRVGGSVQLDLGKATGKNDPLPTGAGNQADSKEDQCRAL